jgi:nucleoside-diphosphate-sugar epimerase
MSEVALTATVPGERRALLVGGTGYLGGALRASLTASGWRVFVVETRPDAPESAAPGDDWTDPAEWHGDQATLQSLVERSQPDVVVFLAAHYIADHTAGDIDPLIDANVRLPAVALDVIRACGVRSVVMAGTYWEEFSDDDPAPADLYAATRCAAKSIARFFADAYGLTVAWLRVSDIYGPGDERGKLFSHLRRAAVTGDTLVMSPGEQLVAPVHLGDATEAFRLATALVAERAWTGVREFGVQSRDALSLRDAVATYAQVIGRPVPVEFGGRPYRDREVMTPVFLPPVPAWSPAFDLRSGLEDMERAAGGLLAG